MRCAPVASSRTAGIGDGEMISFGDILTIAFGVVSLFGITISPSLLDTGNPLVFGILAASILLIGCFIGWQICKHRIDIEVKKAEAVERVRLEKAEEDRKREEEEREAAELKKLNGFSVAQLQCMLGCFCGETAGGAGIMTKFDDPTANSLVEHGVFTTHAGKDLDHYTFVLTPEWRSCVESHENDMRVMLGLDMREGGLPSEEDVESHLQYLHSKAYA